MSGAEVLGRQFPRRIPVENVGMVPPMEPWHQRGATVEAPEGTRQPRAVKKLLAAIPVVKPTTVDPSKLSVRATQPYLTRGSLTRQLDGPKRGRAGGSPEVPVMFAHADGHHYVLDGHHRVAGAMLRGEPLQAKVLTSRHRQLADQVQLGGEHVRDAYRQAGLTPGVSHEERNEAFKTFYPEYLKNPARKELGLPPRRRR